MSGTLINAFLALLEGLGLIVSPCILPLLPIILSGSLVGSKQRPFGIIIGFVCSFALFTYFSRQLVLWFNLDLTLVRNASLILLLSFGLIMISSYLSDKFTSFTQSLSNLGLKLTERNNSQDFLSGIIFGVLVGLIWTPCAGPIFAAVIVQSILQPNSFSGFIIIVAFAIGAAIPMLLIALFGQSVMRRTTALQQHAAIIRKLLGVIIIVAVLFMYFGTSLFAATSKPEDSKSHNANTLLDGLAKPYPAPDFTDITAWINSPPLHMQELRGKVVLIDFWAYSCINCIRTLPYLIQWYNDYHDKGLIIVGVHSPEFDFERDLNNVQKAVKQDGITYPVALDNNFATWQQYNNHYWPAHYLIDQNGNVVYTHFGEGRYDVTENNIRYLLNLNAKSNNKQTEVDLLHYQTPETYCGYERADHYAGSPALVPDVATTYVFPPELALDAWALNGSWVVAQQKITSNSAEAAIRINFQAKHVYAVLGTNDKKPVKVKVMYNNALLTRFAGADVKDGTLEVNGYQLYRLIDMPQNSSGLLELQAESAGLELYTFTFG